MSYPTATIETTAGTLTLELWDDVAPKHVENFKKLALDGFYDGVNFHRIIKDFMIQGGCPDGTGSGGPGWTINAEFNDREHHEGVLSMARTADPNSAGSQFFICLKAASFLDGEYTCFGELIKGMDVLETLGEVPCGGGGEGSRPEERQDVMSITIVSHEDAGVE